MKSFTLLVALCAAATPPVFASNFSPYADLTLNVHWDSTYQDLEPFDLTSASLSSRTTSYHLAFITDAGNCSPAWGAQSSYSVAAKWGAHLTDKMREKNISTVVSFGGASGNDLSKACNAADLSKIYEDVISIYQPQGLDFDIENGTADVSKIMAVLHEVQSKHPKLALSFTLPVLPEGLTTGGQEVVNQAKAAGLIYNVNIMAMDYGPAYVNDMGAYAVQAATSLYFYLNTLYPDKPISELWKMIEVTPMIGVNDVNVERFTLTDVDKLRNFAKQHGIGGLSYWSVSRDNPCADDSASSVCSGANLQTVPYEFAQRFTQ
jgi:chitinase